MSDKPAVLSAEMAANILNIASTDKLFLGDAEESALRAIADGSVVCVSDDSLKSIGTIVARIESELHRRRAPAPKGEPDSEARELVRRAEKEFRDSIGTHGCFACGLGTDGREHDPACSVALIRDLAAFIERGSK